MRLHLVEHFLSLHILSGPDGLQISGCSKAGNVDAHQRAENEVRHVGCRSFFSSSCATTDPDLRSASGENRNRAFDSIATTARRSRRRDAARKSNFPCHPPWKAIRSCFEVAAITGHASLRELERYTKAVAQGKLAESAIAKVAK